MQYLNYAFCIGEGKAWELCWIVSEAQYTFLRLMFGI